MTARSAWLLALAGTAVLGACGGPPPPPPPPPPTLDLSVTGGADQNPDQDGTAAPVNVHLYQLASLGKFERADVFPLTEKEEATLGTDLLASEEFFIAPGETHPVSEELRKGARFLGAAVLFRDIDRARWRASAPVAANGPTKLVLAISGVTATLTTSK